jgi:hypothetical protein
MLAAVIIITVATLPGRQKAGVKFTVVPPERRDLAAIIDGIGLLQEPSRIGEDLRLQIDHRAVFPQQRVCGRAALAGEADDLSLIVDL